MTKPDPRVLAEQFIIEWAGREAYDDVLPLWLWITEWLDGAGYPRPKDAELATLANQVETLINTATITVTWPDHTKTQPDDGHLEDPNPSNKEIKAVTQPDPTPISEAWAHLIEALTLLATRGDKVSPLHCEHDTLRVMADPALFTNEEIRRLETLGFHADPYCGYFYSFRYGSA